MPSPTRRGRRSLALAATLVATTLGGTLTACGGDATTVEKASADAADSARFQDLWRLAGQTLNLPTGQTYAYSSDVNQALGLDDHSPIRYDAYYFPRADHGYWCATSTSGTFITEIVSGAKATYLLGDGPCSDALTDADVVGNTSTHQWTKGADLMDSTTMQPWGRIDADTVAAEQPSPAVLAATSSVAMTIMNTFARTGVIPTPMRIDAVLDAAKHSLPDHLSVRDYAVTKTIADPSFTFCALDTATGDWARYDSDTGGVTTSGVVDDADSSASAACD